MVLGAAGLLVGGYAITASVAVESPVAPPQAAPVHDSAAQWAARAQFALISVDRQLDTIAQTEEIWSRLPDSTRAGTSPVQVRQLEDRKALLERQRAMLQSQLAAYRSLGQTADELAQSEQHLAAIEKALADVPAPGQRSPAQAAAIAGLAEQRELRLRQRDAKREELRTLDAGVQSATRAPLPDDGQPTAQVSTAVLAPAAQLKGGGRPPVTPTITSRPDAVAVRRPGHGRAPA